MKRDYVYRCWSPPDGCWSDWVKPVLFANIDTEVEPLRVLVPTEWLGREVVEPLNEVGPVAAASAPEDTAIVIDVPGERGTCIGVALIDYGYRPIPLYNAVQREASIVNLQPVVDVLVSAAERLRDLPLAAPPAFLLDAHRMSGAHLIGPGVFDNRSVCRASDFPSAQTLAAAGIRRVLLIQDEAARPAPDLEPILLSWQRAGIQLWRKATGYRAPAAPFVLRPRPLLFRWAHAMRRILLQRGRDGAYGHFVETPSAG